MNLKHKIIFLLSFLIVIVVVTVSSYNLIHEKQENTRRLNDAKDHVYRTYRETINDTVRFYAARSAANLSSPGILDAFRAGDHERLYRLMQPRWKVMQRENPWLSVLQFHQADGRSLLRMHQPDVYGDTISLQRPMVAHAHATKQPLFGFEEGRQGLAFRILVPVLERGEYIGLVEFGITPPYFTDKIRRFVGYESFFFIKQEVLGHFGTFPQSLQIGQNIGLHIPLNYRTLIQEYSRENQNLHNGVISYLDHAYEINVIPINNFRSASIGSIMFIRPTEDFAVHVRHAILSAGFISLLLIIIVAFITDKIYTFIVRKMSFQERYAQTILDSVPSPVIVTNGEELIAANESFLNYFHVGTIEEFKEDHQCVCEYFEEGGTDEYLMSMRDDKRWTEYMLEHPMKSHKAKITIDGDTTIFEVRISALKRDDQVRYVVIFNDISTMQIQSIRDSLTGIANRLHFSMVYQHAFNVAKRTSKPLSILFFDIDHFKRVNDIHGHLVGDMVLKHLASLVDKRIRNSDIFARWGGEEFILLLPDTTLEEAIALAHALKEAIGSEPFETVKTITCSFGAAQLQEDESHESFLKRSDEKLYEAKKSGRDRVVF